MSTPTSDPTTACFFVTAQVAPGVMPRVLELFAKRGLVPDRFDCRRDGSALTLDIAMHGMDLELARYIGRCMNQIFEVDCVLVSEKRYAYVA